MIDTREHIISVTTRLVQEKGYNAFSYNDIAESLGIRKASIHYHFPAKSVLVQTIMAAYREQHSQELATINRKTANPVQKLKKFANLFSKTLGDDYVMCPSGMLASDVGALPAEILDEVQGFFHDSEHWLTGVLREGRKQGLLEFTGTAADNARTFFAALEGALLAARAFNDHKRLDSASRLLIQSLLTRK